MSQPDTTLTEPALLVRERTLTRMLEQLWYALLLVAVVAGLVSIQRFRFTGWLPIYSLHLLLMGTYISCWIIRKKLSFTARVNITLLLFYCVGIGGIFSFGIVGGGFWWLILSALLAHMFYTFRIGMMHVAFCIAVIVLAGIGHTSGYISLPFDANEYITRISTWLNLLIGCGFVSMFIISAISTYQREILKLLSEVEKIREQQNLLIHEQQQAIDEIHMLRSIIPICAGCKKIRDDKGFWETVEGYFQKHSDIQFSHSICPDCGEALVSEELQGPNSNKKGEDK